MDFRFSLCRTDFSIGVLYLSASVGNMFKNRFTAEIGNATVKTQTPFNVSIAKKPMGYESL
jgi:hypothetical protein